MCSNVLTRISVGTESESRSGQTKGKGFLGEYLVAKPSPTVPK